MRALLALVLLSSVAYAQPKGKTATVSGSVKVMEADGKTEVSGVEVVVYVVGPADEPGKEEVKATITQTGDRKFVPDLVAITTGEKVEFPNGGKLLHNVFSPKPKFDLGSFDKGEKKDTKDAFKNYKGTAEIYCNIHPEMAATILVLPNPYHVAVDKKTKTFTIKNVPMGKDFKLYAYTRRMEKPVMKPLDTSAGDAKQDFVITRGAETKHLNKYGEKYKDGKSYP